MINQQKIYLFVLYFCGFLLLWEWLRPLTEITNTGQVQYFVIFIALSLIINVLPLYSSVRTGTKIVFILYFLYNMFAGEHSSFIAWSIYLIEDVIFNIGLLFSLDVVNITDLFRTVLFFILLWIMTYLLRYWLTIRKKIFVFYSMTVIYIAVIDTFTIYNAEWAIVRIVMIGFILLGILFFQRLLEKENIRNRYSLLAQWTVPLALMILISTFIGYVSPKAGPIWPDPVPFLKSNADNVMPRNNGGVSKIGYGSDDTNLGGPFIGDDSVVFEVWTQQGKTSGPAGHYWKVETKDTYTGKGWTTSVEAVPDFEVGVGTEFRLPFDIPIETERQRRAHFDMKLLYPHIIYPYGVMGVDGDISNVKMITALEKFIPFSAENEIVSPSEYAVSYETPQYSLQELRNTTSIFYSLPDGVNEELVNEFLEGYTQLPDTLPERVRHLAHELTMDHHNWYDKAKAIEAYFKNGEFTYDQEKAAVPGKNQDYVDQFLFETQVGYCDNFSTSMVTLLRAVDIPARWVKGYTSGHLIDTVADSTLFEVTNNETHSWVEVFFPSQGWVPFEPTIGFTNFSSIVDENAVPEEPTEEEPVTQPTEPTTPEPTEPETPTETNNEPDTEVKTSFWETIKTFITNNWIVIVGCFIVLLLLGVLAYWKRSKWLPYVLVRKYKRKHNSDTLVHAYGDLLKQLKRIGLEREIGQTLRDYSSNIDSYFHTDEMSKLTEQYERAIYRGDNSQGNWESTSELWENLIKRTTG
nr:DUF4129 domain-containing transglutaminase family protein [Paenibacillus bovis]